MYPREFQLVATSCRRMAVRGLASSVVVPCVYISRGKQEHLIVLFAKLQAKATELTTDSLTVIGWASLEL